MDGGILPKGTIVYRSYTDESNKNGYWFSLHPNHTYGYGPITGEFILLKDLKLINIANEKFYDKLKDALKDATNYNEKLKEIHSDILFPLGFDDSSFYRDFAKNSGFNYIDYNLNPLVHTESLLYFNNRSRLSIYKYDIKLMEFLHNIFGDISDGIICQKFFPDKIRNGFHLPELSVFDNKNIEYVKEHVRPVQGGSLDNNKSNTLILEPIPKDNISDWAKERISKADIILKNMIPVKSNIKINFSKIINGGSINSIKNTKRFNKTYKKKKNKN